MKMQLRLTNSSKVQAYSIHGIELAAGEVREVQVSKELADHIVLTCSGLDGVTCEVMSASNVVVNSPMQELKQENTRLTQENETLTTMVHNLELQIADQARQIASMQEELDAAKQPVEEPVEPPAEETPVKTRAKAKAKTATTETTK